jgi:hypothetical protein
MAEKEPSKVEDLWPSAALRPDFRAPAAILKEQATLLSERTGFVVLGEVTSFTLKNSKRLAFAFNIVASRLNNYRLRILSIAHEPTRVYPTWIIPALFPKGEDGNPQVLQTEDEKAFIEKVREIFADETTVLAIKSLWVQSESGASSPDDEIPF